MQLTFYSFSGCEILHLLKSTYITHRTFEIKQQQQQQYVSTSKTKEGKTKQICIDNLFDK